MLPNPLAYPFAPPVPTPAPTPSQPTLPALSAFLLSHLPQISPLASAAEVPWLYHTPHAPRGSNTRTNLPPKTLVSRLVLSITPTEGIYTALGSPPSHQNQRGPTLSTASTPIIPAPAPASTALPLIKPPDGERATTQAAFLHRPWALNRARLPRGTAVWASHKAFDEGLTVGCNLALMGRLLGPENAADGNAKLLVGYKGDEGRRVGVVVGAGEGGIAVGEVGKRIRREFGDFEREGGAWFGDWEGESKDAPRVRAVACMNAFHPEEVERVAGAAVEGGFADGLGNCDGVVYLTGAVRDEGLKSAREKGMRVVCVGHRVCEAWGIGFLAEKVREQWPGVDVRVIDEEEIVVPKKRKGGGDLVEKKQNRKNDAAKPEEAKSRRVSEEEEDGGVAL